MTINSDWVADLQDQLREFASARGWEQYHTLRNLAALIASEAGELLALYRWDQDAFHDRPDKVVDELADVLLGVLRFADVAGIDLQEAAHRKLAKNAEKYPTGPRGPDPVESEVVCGIDAGTFKSDSYVAWLRGREIRLEQYRATPATPLPAIPHGWAAPRVVAYDLPQGLARAGAPRRQADAGASTPTSILPASRAALATWRLYRGLIEAGIETFWAIHSSSLGVIAGLGHAEDGRPLIVETYPRYVLKRLWPEFIIPSKRKEPEAYTKGVWKLFRERGYVSSPPPTRPDHVDAMLCALAAEACLGSPELPAGTVGTPPYIDAEDNLIREGYIVAP